MIVGRILARVQRLRIGWAVLVVLSWSACALAQPLPPAVVSGTVVDSVGAAVTGAPVALTIVNGSPIQATMTGKVSLRFLTSRRESTSFASTWSGSIHSRAIRLPSTMVDSPEIAAHRAGRRRLSTSVVVRGTEAIAEEQIKAQEQQRWFGVVPNFYVSYVPDAAPLTSRQKLTLATHETFDWMAFVGASVAAGDRSVHGRAPGFRRWRIRVRETVGGKLRRRPDRRPVEPLRVRVVFHQDPRYFYQGTGSTKSRLIHALSSRSSLEATGERRCRTMPKSSAASAPRPCPTSTIRIPNAEGA